VDGAQAEESVTTQQQAMSHWFVKQCPLGLQNPILPFSWQGVVGWALLAIFIPPTHV
jgi:hypothetical protein